MLINEVAGIFNNTQLLPKILVIGAGLLFASLLVYILIHPFLKLHGKSTSIQMHPDASSIVDLPLPSFNKIAVALDFTENDKKLIAYALGQGKSTTSYLFIHVVESASAKLLGKESDDFETRKDSEQMDFYIQSIKEKGLQAEGVIAFKNRAKEIIKVVKEHEADMLVIGAHGHTALKDLIYGQTVNTVRHELKIPVLVVNL
jgi:manganese transport protein